MYEDVLASSAKLMKVYFVIVLLTMDIGNTLIESGCVLQKYDVNGFATMELNDLDFVKQHNQGKLRTNLYRRFKMQSLKEM